MELTEFELSIVNACKTFNEKLSEISNTIASKYNLPDAGLVKKEIYELYQNNRLNIFDCADIYEDRIRLVLNVTEEEPSEIKLTSEKYEDKIEYVVSERLDIDLKQAKKICALYDYDIEKIENWLQIMTSDFSDFSKVAETLAQAGKQVAESVLQTSEILNHFPKGKRPVKLKPFQILNKYHK